MRKEKKGNGNENIELNLTYVVCGGEFHVIYENPVLASMKYLKISTHWVYKADFSHHPCEQTVHMFNSYNNQDY